MRTVDPKSAWSQYGPEGAFTPKVSNPMIMSPSDSQMIYSPQPSFQSPGYIAGTPAIGAVGTSPYVAGYNGATPIGSQAYSPAGAGGAGSQHAAYSPTSLNNLYQSPAYSPTTPNYVNYGSSNAPM